MASDRDDRPTETIEAASRAAPAAARLLVLTENVAETFPLPPSGKLLVGRSTHAHVRIDHPAISRSHVMLYVDRGRVELEELGSRHGARLHGRALSPNERVELLPGDVVELGPVTVVLQSKPAASSQAAAATSMGQARQLAERLARGTISVLLVGETGVGKEVLAGEIHARSPRRDRPFVAINCGALPEPLIESELFGHERGAFTGADQAKPGLLETADGGTLFLDEIGELSPAVQVKLLRALEARTVLRVGALKPRPIDVRLVSATNRDLERAIADGSFRKDLYFRISAATIRIPPLRERLDELEALARGFIADGCEQAGRASRPSLAPDALAALRAYAWPGNIRELRNVIERALLLCEGASITTHHLSLGQEASVGASSTASSAHAHRHEALARELGELERSRLVDALEQAGGNQTQAAKRLGISRGTLIKRIDEFGLRRPRKPIDRDA